MGNWTKTYDHDTLVNWTTTTLEYELLVTCGEISFTIEEYYDIEKIKAKYRQEMKNSGMIMGWHKIEWKDRATMMQDIMEYSEGCSIGMVSHVYKKDDVKHIIITKYHKGYVCDTEENIEE